MTETKEKGELRGVDLDRGRYESEGGRKRN
jgi:hypothetical protein